MVVNTTDAILDNNCLENITKLSPTHCEALTLVPDGLTLRGLSTFQSKGKESRGLLG